jgi:hypothetical protein
VTRRIKARALSARLESMDVRRDEVFRRVLEVLGAYAVSQGEAEALLASLGTREDFIRLIRAIINDPHWLHLIAENSYRHALGFDKLIVAPLLPTGQLRLHVWWPGDPRTREHIHNHRFAFSSIVVSGRLRNHVFETTRIPEGAKPYRRFVEDAQLRDHRWQFTASGNSPPVAPISSDRCSSAVSRYRRATACFQKSSTASMRSTHSRSPYSWRERRRGAEVRYMWSLIASHRRRDRKAGSPLERSARGCMTSAAGSSGSRERAIHAASQKCSTAGLGARERGF